jgi:hypothetical protein
MAVKFFIDSHLHASSARECRREPTWKRKRPERKKRAAARRASKRGLIQIV